MSSFLFVLTQAIEANSSANISNVAIINSLISLGNKVEVLCPYPNNQVDNPLDERAIISRIGNKPVETISNTKVINNKNNWARNIIKKFYYLFNVYDRTITLSKKVNIEALKQKQYDYVVSLSDPKTSHIAVMHLKKQGLKYNKWIQYWGDPLTIDITRLSKLPKPILLKKEKKLLNQADIIIYVSPFTCEAQKKLFKSNSNKMFFVPPPYPREEEFIEKNPNNHICIGYFGAYESFVRNIMPIYETFSEKSVPKELELLLVGNSDLQLEEKDNIRILSRVPFKEAETLQSECDILFCITNKCGTQIPAKVYYSAATYKPIIIAVDGELSKRMKEYFETFDRFIVCNNDKKEITKSIHTAIDLIGKCKPCLSLSPKSVAEEFVGIINEIGKNA